MCSMFSLIGICLDFRRSNRYKTISGLPKAVIKACTTFRSYLSACFNSLIAAAGGNALRYGRSAAIAS